MTTNIWKIVWRDSRTGNIRETAQVSYTSYAEADAALTTLLGFRAAHLTPTIEREIADVP